MLCVLLCCVLGMGSGGMSIDYVKCFDLIPQAVVLALALELGMDPGTCRALRATYKQLRRGPPPMVASHQWHPPGLPPVGDPSECPHHDVEVRGGLPTI